MPRMDNLLAQTQTSTPPGKGFRTKTVETRNKELLSNELGVYGWPGYATNQTVRRCCDDVVCLFVILQGLCRACRGFRV